MAPGVFILGAIAPGSEGQKSPVGPSSGHPPRSLSRRCLQILTAETIKI